MTVPVAGFTIPVKYWYFSSLYFCTIKLCAHISIYIVLNEATRNRTFESNYYSLIRKSEDKSVKFLSILMSQNKAIETVLQEPYSVAFPWQKQLFVEILWLHYSHSLNKKEYFYDVRYYLTLSIAIPGRVASHVSMPTYRNKNNNLYSYGKLDINKIFSL